MSNERELRIRMSSNPVGIPYGPVKRSNSENYGYKSLLEFPELIDSIPEVEGYPALKAFIADINGADGIFESIRCEQWIRPKNDDVMQHCFCMGFAFRDRELFSGANSYVMFAGNFLEYALEYFRGCSQAPLFDLQPALFIDEQCGGWVMDIYFEGVGEDADRATQHLAEMLSIAKPFFLKPTLEVV